MEGKKAEELREKYKDISEETVEKTADAIIKKGMEDKMEHWRELYIERAVKDYDETIELLNRFGVPGDQFDKKLFERVTLILKELTELRGTIKGIEKGIEFYSKREAS